MTTPDPRRKGRNTLLLMFGLALVPILAAQAVYHWWRPAGGASYGQMLLTPDTLASAPQWRLLAHDPAGCTALQGDLTFAARQFTVGQGREADRMRYGASRACPNPRVADAGLETPRQPLPGAGLYLIDPHGNAVVRYAPQQLDDIDGRRRVMSEIGKFLKNNKGLG
ncbi:hypothetical protein GCM10007860_27480 [Chitiniphilus shinanonensis]|uniref:Transmembrane protein n=1 Tax=Chitiniphilus shinanonensis TaxID=553088 RepID=A0ABQ6BYI8_9NEIS|nr:hypothetical protein [Chitiniphilus shinanonensis]GLS05591.1 hypothetical protein GCM10007860_27480 [Chitiniphilus shinanonensis]